MELTAIYHRPESEYAYLYKDKTMHIRIRTKKGDIESVHLHYGDPFIFIEDRYEAIKEMTKLPPMLCLITGKWMLRSAMHDFSISLNSRISKVRASYMAIRDVLKTR